MPKAGSGPGMNWDEGAKTKLLTSIIHLGNVGSIDWNAVLKHSGLPTTAEGCRQKFNHIKRDAAKAGGDSDAAGGEDGSEADKATIAKKRKALAAKAKKGTAKKVKQSEEQVEDEEEGDDLIPV